MKKIRPLKSTSSTLFTYTILFCVLMAGIFALFWIQGRSFVNSSDAYDQGYFWTAEMGNHIRSLLGGDGYPLWSWDRGTGLDTKLPIDPFMVFASLFPAGKIELGYTIAILLRLYFAGFAFILFCREMELDNFKALFGALCYVSCSFTINVALVQGQFIDLFILFPLLVLSVDLIYKGKSAVPFMLTVGITAGINYYLAYMAAIGIVIYIIFRYFHYREFNAKDYFAYLGRFIVYGITGILLSAIFVYVTIVTLSGASTGSRPALELLYDTAHYYKSLTNLLSEGYTFGYKYIGIPILALLVIPAVKGKPSIRATHVIMSVIMCLMALTPFCGSMFNAFSYETKRWYFMLIFFLVWTAAEHIDLDELAKGKNVIIMLFWWAILTFTTLGFAYLDITGDMPKRHLAFVGGNLAAGLVMILFIWITGRLKVSLRLRQTLITIAVMGTLVLVWNASFYGHIEKKFFKFGEINEQLEASTQRAGALIQDDGFYRIDQVDWINAHLKADQPVNENLWWGNDTIYIYDSKLPSRLSEFNRLVGNNMGYSKRVYMQSNGQRMGLDFLYGVKYFLGDDVKNDRLGADAYAGYAFDYYDNLDGVNVYKSRYKSSLGFLYDKFMTETEFSKLSRLEREQALMQALVVPDEEAADLDETKQVTAADIETEIKDVPYEIIEHEDIKIDGNTLTVEKDDASILLSAGPAENCQLVVSFDDLRRVNDAGEDIGNFKLKCRKDGKQAEASNQKNNQTIPGIVDYDLNLGYYDYCAGNIRIKFSKAGKYEFDKLYVSAMSTGLFDKYAAERCESVYEVTDRGPTLVTGTLDAKNDGWLFLSIPVNTNWNVYIDGGRVAEIHNANIAFFATPVTKGKHTVELRYDHHNRNIALIMSGAGLLLMILCAVIDRKRRKKEKEQKNENEEEPYTEKLYAEKLKY